MQDKRYYSPLLGQKALRTRRREERKGKLKYRQKDGRQKKEKFNHRNPRTKDAEDIARRITDEKGKRKEARFTAENAENFGETTSDFIGQAQRKKRKLTTETCPN